MSRRSGAREGMTYTGGSSNLSLSDFPSRSCEMTSKYCLGILRNSSKSGLHMSVKIAWFGSSLLVGIHTSFVQEFDCRRHRTWEQKLEYWLRWQSSPSCVHAGKAVLGHYQRLVLLFRASRSWSVLTYSHATSAIHLFDYR